MIGSLKVPMKYSNRLIKEFSWATGLPTWQVKKILPEMEKACLFRPVSTSDSGHGIELLRLPESMSDVKRWLNQSQDEWKKEELAEENISHLYCGLYIGGYPKDFFNKISHLI
jgi:hypothetical protein